MPAELAPDNYVMKQIAASPTRWRILDFALCGAILGVSAVLAHQVEHVLSDDIRHADPFMHAILEFGAGSLTGSLLFALIPAIRHCSAGLRKRNDARDGASEEQPRKKRFRHRNEQRRE